MSGNVVLHSFDDGEVTLEHWKTMLTYWQSMMPVDVEGEQVTNQQPGCVHIAMRRRGEKWTPEVAACRLRVESVTLIEKEKEYIAGYGDDYEMHVQAGETPPTPPRLADGEDDGTAYALKFSCKPRKCDVESEGEDDEEDEVEELFSDAFVPSWNSLNSNVAVSDCKTYSFIVSNLVAALTPTTNATMLTKRLRELLREDIREELELAAKRPRVCPDETKVPDDGLMDATNHVFIVVKERDEQNIISTRGRICVPQSVFVNEIRNLEKEPYVFFRSIDYEACRVYPPGQNILDGDPQVQACKLLDDWIKRFRVHVAHAWNPKFTFECLIRQTFVESAVSV